MDVATMQHLIALYAGLVLLNTVVSVILWRIGRTSLHRDLFLLWAATFFAFVAQGVVSTSEIPLVRVYGFSAVFLVNLSLSRLISGFLPVRVPIKASLIIFGSALFLAGAASSAGLPFVVIAMPIALAVAVPLVGIARPVFTEHWKGLSFTEKALVVAAMLFVVHSLDFPFMGNDPSLAEIGISIALGLVFGLSIFAPAVVLELVAGREARANAELDVAHRIQMKLVPSKPKLPGLDLSCYMQPAHKVGGDYYDVYSFGGYSWILMGDVTGHGLGSGLVMLMAQSILSAILHTRSEITPAELNYLANKVLHQNLARLDDERSMTIVAMSRNEESGRFLFSGNHEGVYVLRAATGQVETLDVAQVPHGLGFLDEFRREEYGESSLSLQPGDTMLLATDGIIEAADGGDYNAGMFSERRLRELLLETAGRPLEEIKTRLIAELQAFTNGVFHDDVTFLLVRAD